LGAAGNRGVEHVNAAFAEFRGNVTGGVGGDGRAIDQYRIWRHARDQAVRAEGDGRDVGAGGDDGGPFARGPSELRRRAGAGRGVDTNGKPIPEIERKLAGAWQEIENVGRWAKENKP
jgi:hypothetical protein